MRKYGIKIKILIIMLTLGSQLYLSGSQDNGGVVFSVRSGFYNAPFYLTLTSSDPAAQIIITLDGSNPQNSSNSIKVSSPASVLIDPENDEGRPLTPAVIVRASITKPGFSPSYPATRSYIFPEKVKIQTWPGGEWPDGSINGQQVDLEMDAAVVNDPEYSGLVDDALLSLPTISVATDLKNLFDPDSGIYVNATGRGTDWERECSVELINPDGSEGFMVNAGLRIRGGSSRGRSFLKHGFRLFFREKYGNDNLDYPLFGDEGTNQFDKIDLRTDQDYSWSNGWNNSSFVREVFSRDTQRDMDQPYTRSRYYHLYIDGMYWGLYQTQERSEARFASSYLGGSEEDYDVLKINIEDWSYTVEATDGNLESWGKLWELCSKGFISNKDYFNVEGKDENGKPVKGGEVLVNIDNLIDYMLVIFYSGNFDSPTSAFLKNKKGNNYYAIDNREDRSTGFTFFVHDAENSLMDEAIYPGIGLYEDRVNIGTRTDEMKMEVNDFADFHPQWLHYNLSANSEYKSRFADRAYRQFQTGGVFSPESALARINKRIKEIDLAVIAESARWGDARTGESYAYTRNDNWLREIKKIRTDFIPFRTQIVIDQLKAAGLYPELEAPLISGPGGNIIMIDVPLTSPITIKIENPNNSGSIYYCLDGDDPRLPGGGINTQALSSQNGFNLPISTSARIKTRILSGGNWSGIKEVNFIKQQLNFNDLKVTELHYHPADYFTNSDTIDGKDLEFIEFKNTGKSLISLSGLALDSAVHYQFPKNGLLAPAHFFVVVSNPSKFYEYYGLFPSGYFQGNFSNAGEEVILKDSNNNNVIDFTYEDSEPWPSKADGGGYSLSSKEKNPVGDPADYHYWTLSSIKDGTPFADNSLSDPQVTDSLSLGTLIAFPNPTAGSVTLGFAGEEEGNQIELWLFNSLGQPVVHTFSGNFEIIDWAPYGLPAGMYILKGKTEKYSGKVPLILLKKQ